MQNNKISELKINCKKYIDDEFINKIVSKFHYDNSDIALISEVLSEIKNYINESTVVSINRYCADVCFSLGSGIDYLSDKYSEDGKMLNQIILDNCCMELMREAYVEIDEYITQITNTKIKGRFFYGDEVDSLVKIKYLLTKLGRDYVACNEAGVMKPLKSVLYSVILMSDDYDDCNNISSETINICSNCSRGLARKCSYYSIDNDWRLHNI